MPDMLRDSVAPMRELLDRTRKQRIPSCVSCACAIRSSPQFIDATGVMLVPTLFLAGELAKLR